MKKKVKITAAAFGAMNVELSRQMLMLHIIF